MKTYEQLTAEEVVCRCELEQLLADGDRFNFIAWEEEDMYFPFADMLIENSDSIQLIDGELIFDESLSKEMYEWICIDQKTFNNQTRDINTKIFEIIKGSICK